MPLSNQAVKNLMTAAASQEIGNLVADGVNAGLLASHVIAGLIVATNVSQTVDFASLMVGDKVLAVATAAGAGANPAHFVTVATAGTLGEAAIVGSLYVVLRAKDAASAVKF